MKSTAVVLLFGLTTLCCNNPAPNTTSSIVNNDSTALTDTPKERNYTEEILATIPKNITPIMGYRFFIEGDFDGDGKKEKLTEHYISGIDGKETNKFYDSTVSYEQLVALTDKKEPILFVLCSNKKIDTLKIAKGHNFGLSMLRNEGDLNGDGRDEISFMGYWVDWSSSNSIHIYTNTKNGWEELHQIESRDWEAPELYESDISMKDWSRPIYINGNKIPGYRSRIKKLSAGIIAVNTYNKYFDAIIDTIILAPKIK